MDSTPWLNADNLGRALSLTPIPATSFILRTSAPASDDRDHVLPPDLRDPHTCYVGPYLLTGEWPDEVVVCPFATVSNDGHYYAALYARRASSGQAWIEPVSGPFSVPQAAERAALVSAFVRQIPGFHVFCAELRDLLLAEQALTQIVNVGGWCSSMDDHASAAGIAKESLQRIADINRLILRDAVLERIATPMRDSTNRFAEAAVRASSLRQAVRTQMVEIITAPDRLSSSERAKQRLVTEMGSGRRRQPRQSRPAITGSTRHGRQSRVMPRLLRWLSLLVGKSVCRPRGAIAARRGHDSLSSTPEDKPMSASQKQFQLSITYQRFAAGSADDADPCGDGHEIERQTFTLEQVAQIAGRYGIECASTSTPEPGRTYFLSTTPIEDRERSFLGLLGCETYYSLYVDSVIFDEQQSAVSTEDLSELADAMGVRFNGESPDPASYRMPRM